MRTPERIARIKGVLSLRQPDLHVVLEKVANPHNANAVLRTCDAAGVLHVDIIGSDSEETPINSAITTRADKWLQIRHHPTTEACLSGLRERGFQIAATDLGADTLPYTRLDMTKPTALVFGGEKEGLSPQALELADVKIKIPMFGMAQSLNLSVSAGIILYEALRQRLERGFFDRPRLSPEEFEAELDRWLDL
jgi:tRNA (guanosine-2'-O-)-methyltransferase